MTARVGRVAADRRDDEAVLLGVHLEGPALSPARSAGHDPRSLLPPSSLLASLRADPAAWSTVRVVTMAPELSGGPELIAALAQAGIVASLGHTDASTAEACAAYAAGVRSTTHLFSGMPPLGHRLPGPVGAALAMAPFVELLCDGMHVDAMLLPSLARAIGADRLLLVSDAVPLAGSRRQSMTVAGAKLRIRDGRVVDGEGTLAGSLQLLDGMVASAVRSGIPIAVALRAATQNPADLLGISDRGRVATGAAADLVLVGRDGGLRGLVPV